MAMELEHRGAQRRTEEPLGQITEAIIASAMTVHSALGPGLLEAAYENCLCCELMKRGLSFERQRQIPIHYQGMSVQCGFRADLIIERRAIVEIKAVDQLTSIHESQLLTYLRLSKLPVGLLINFNVRHLRDGIRRRVA